MSEQVTPLHAAAERKARVSFAGEIVLLSATALVFAFALFEARKLSEDARPFPILVGCVGLIFALGSVAQLVFRRDVARGTDEDVPELDRTPPSLKRDAMFWAWLVAFCAAVWLFGFYIGVPVVAGAFTMALSERRVRGFIAGVGMGVVTWFYLYVIFTVWFGVPWFEGILLE